MPELDVSFMVDDPMFQDSFNILRRSAAVTTKGRSNPVPAAPVPATGTVTQDDPDELIRNPDGQLVPRKIRVFTAFQVFGANASSQPDLIDWNGTQYLVTEVLPYSRYGSGFYEVIAESQTMPDAGQ